MPPKVPNYRIERLIGVGSSAQVWSARSVRTGERVAIKWLPRSSPAAADAARAEAQVLARLDHPHLIRLREFCACAGGDAVVLDLADGGSLAQLLRRRKLAPGEVVAALAPVAAALAHAHDRGVVHGDVSAGNILFTADGYPQLADLGLARVLSLRAPNSATAVGTPAYLDPCVAAGVPPVPASDVFALGAVALHCVTGLGPWQRTNSDSDAQVLERAARFQPADLSARLDGVPERLAAAVGRALQLEPSRRGSAAEFALDLGAALPHASVVVTAGRLGAGLARPAGRSGHAGVLTHVPTDLTRLARRTADDSAPEPVHSAAARVVPALVQRLRKAEGAVQRLRKAEGAVAARQAPRHGRRPRRVGIARWCGLGVALVTTGIVVGGPVSWARPASAPGAGLVADAPSQRQQRGSTPELPAAQMPARLRGRDTAEVSRALAALRVLDAARAEAYALRRPELLARLYLSPQLLALDRSALVAAVPPGCGMLGLSSVFAGIHVLRADSARLELEVTSIAEGAELRCGVSAGGSPHSRRLRPGSPVRMRVKLELSGGMLRIASQEAL